jgi:hypothetical protein
MSNEAHIAKLDAVARSLIAAYEQLGVRVAMVRPHGADDVRVFFPLGDVPECAELLYQGADALAAHAGSQKRKVQ